MLTSTNTCVKMSQILERKFVMTEIEKILKIEDADNFNHDGFKISTSKQDIYILIDNRISCCETTGYFSTPDVLTDYVGSELLGIELTDTELMTDVIDCEGINVGVDNCMFVTIKTTLGDFQLTVYNDHNGYYGHTAMVRSKQLNFEDHL